MAIAGQKCRPSLRKDRVANFIGEYISEKSIIKNSVTASIIFVSLGLPELALSIVNAAARGCPGYFGDIFHQMRSMNSFVETEMREASRFGTQKPEAKRHIASVMVNDLRSRLEMRGYRVRSFSEDGFEKLEILDLPGRAGDFLRRYKSKMGDKSARIVYDPAYNLNAGGASVATYYPENHRILVDAATLALTDQGALSYLKHEARHARNSVDEAAGLISGHRHGQIYFGGAEGADDLGPYTFFLGIDEVEQWVRQQHDMSFELEKFLKSAKEQGHAYFQDPDRLNAFMGTIERLKLGDRLSPKIQKRLAKEAQTIKASLAESTARKYLSKKGEPIFVFERRGYPEIYVSIDEQDSVLGKSKIFRVTLPSFGDNGARLFEHDGTPATTHLEIPIALSNLRLTSDANLVRQFILKHLEEMTRDTENDIVRLNARKPKVDRLISEAERILRDLLGKSGQ